MVEIIDNQEIWNRSIFECNNTNPYQLFEWGEYKKRFNWKVLRLKINYNGRICFVQMTYKVKFNSFIGWIIGNIIGDLNAFNKEVVFRFIQNQLNIHKIYIRSNFSDKLTSQNSFDLYCNKWKKTSKQIDSEYTFFQNLTKPEEMLSLFSKNFRKNVKRGIESNKLITLKKLQDVDTHLIDKVFRDFSNVKDNISLPSLEEIDEIKHKLGQHIYLGYSIIDNEIVALRAFLYYKDTAIDFWAAANHKARETYSSYVLLYNLLLKSSSLGLKNYDLSGIDPVNNQGVYNFKKGLRAELIQKTGEWEMTNSKVLSFIINKVYLK